MLVLIGPDLWCLYNIDILFVKNQIKVTIYKIIMSGLI